ncbi:TerB family tellurite resistance protein [Skermanella sp. TT6]|uniref:TerB family tellurite resistance protein n=1 Tax=Skermanella cutis TaxID=2775420 RepID=A0ABX7B1G6_9PROT|nr:TerB family tellurite resistance protein [Skermanella sp. TT6]QQP87509.1 TerB family tellurite resistance protein [Skermanella sp. TT6]
MFLSALDDLEKTAFLALADAVIQADYHLAPQEETMLSAMRAEMGLPELAEVPEMDIRTAASVIDSRRSRVAVMLELAGLAYSDGEVHAEEEILLSRIGAEFGFTDDELLAQREWVMRQLALASEAKVMMMEGA